MHTTQKTKLLSTLALLAIAAPAQAMQPIDKGPSSTPLRPVEISVSRSSARPVMLAPAAQALPLVQSTPVVIVPTPTTVPARPAPAAKTPTQKSKTRAPSAATPAQPTKDTSAPNPKPVEKAAPVPAGSARSIAQSMLSSYGWGQDQFGCLDRLWTRESGWAHTATNPSSGAYGIPQSLPGSKMASAGADWRTNPATQITWGLTYIKGRYGSPCGAWAHSEAVNWY
ncbi:hypothetical protein FB459_1967 [Yimella lutea]|uniref:Transglycosylase-like protein with SLT domain n=1 Tax=Yimella lutea TaxID=587872 RepID=A0A542EGP9_9MICO|nr:MULTISPECIES: hypothetical protein [Yimella]TQJ14500.1 hypothetical protein FB459_1967 [Yimella lutea]